MVAKMVSEDSGRSRRGSHQLASADICQMLWDLKYNRGYATLADSSFRMQGTLIHIALAYYYASKMDPPPDWFQREDMQTALEKKGRGFPDAIQKAKEVMLAYREWYTTIEPDPWIPRFIETEFSATVGELDPPPYPASRGEVDRSLDDEIVTCKPDLVVEVPDPSSIRPVYWIPDFKTWKKAWGYRASGLEEWKEDNRFVLDWQVLQNLLIVRKRLPDMDVRGFIIQRTLREPVNGKYDFDRHVLSIPTCAYNEDAPRQLRRCVGIEREIRRNLEKGIQPERSLWACWSGWGPCDFRPLCAAKSPEEKVEVLGRLYVQEKKAG